MTNPESAHNDAKYWEMTPGIRRENDRLAPGIYEGLLTPGAAVTVGSEQTRATAVHSRLTLGSLGVVNVPSLAC
eukprot:COSAG02_NODE_68_length_42582_cov_52.351129_18_plen_74_part_00